MMVSCVEPEVVDENHSLLIKNAAASYGKKFQRISTTIRNEATVDVSEFHLLKEGSTEKEVVDDLSVTLDKIGKHALITQKVKKANKILKSLPAPLEKPEAEKIKRTVAFDGTKSLLNRWEPVVGANRVADQLSFPLNVPFFRSTSTKNFLSNNRGKTPLESELEKLLGVPSKQNEDDQKQTFFLNHKEIMQQRRELARIRAQQSYREAKAWRQNKIKSKKYHRILRRERTKQQLRAFEELVKTDPEAALKKLEELDRARVEERLTLRHRSTGQWAKNKAIHAKYDKQSREVLAQQLRLSKQLTQKVSMPEDSDDDDDDNADEVGDTLILDGQEDNPWLMKPNDYQAFLSGYRKFWDQQQSEKKTQSNTSSTIPDNNAPVSSVKPSISNGDFAVTWNEEMAGENSSVNGLPVKENKKKIAPMSMVNGNWECSVFEDVMKGLINQSKKGGDKDRPGKELDLDDMFEKMEVELKKKFLKKLSSIKCGMNGSIKSMKNNTSKPLKANGMTNGEVSMKNNILMLLKANGMTNGEDLIKNISKPFKANGMTNGGDSMKNNISKPFKSNGMINGEDSMKNSSSKPFKANGMINGEHSMKNNISKPYKANGMTNDEDSMNINISKPFKANGMTKDAVKSLRRKMEKVVADIELNETLVDLHEDLRTANYTSRITDSATILRSPKKRFATDIDPNNFISIDDNKPLKTGIPNMEEAGDDDDEADSNMNTLTLAEAFREDDIARSFDEEKKTIVEGDKVKDVDLSLPGWGEWTGKGLPAISKRKKKQYTIKAPKFLPRKDDRKESVIINEISDSKAKSHQVTELPFPYSGVDVFESSIRAPVGSTWIPETAHNKLTAPKVSTLMGAVIGPLTEDAIVDENEMKDSGDVEDFVPEEL